MAKPAVGWGKQVLEAQLMRAGGYGKIDTRTKSILHLNPNCSIIEPI
jgi:hypothetical protein